MGQDHGGLEPRNREKRMGDARCRVILNVQEEPRRDRGGPEPRNNRTRGRAIQNHDLAARTDLQKLNNEARAINKTIYCVVRTTTGEPVSANALTHMHSHPHRHAHRKTHTRTDAHTGKHTHADNAMELCWKHTGFPRSRGSLPSLRRT